MIKAFRPGYKPSNRKYLLDETNKSVDLLMEEELKTSIITLVLNGWSNKRIDPIIVANIRTAKGIYLLNAVDCESEK